MKIDIRINEMKTTILKQIAVKNMLLEFQILTNYGYCLFLDDLMEIGEKISVVGRPVRGF